MVPVASSAAGAKPASCRAASTSLIGAWDIATVGASTTFLAVPGVLPGTTYYFQIKTLSAFGNSLPGAEVAALAVYLCCAALLGLDEVQHASLSLCQHALT